MEEPGRNVLQFRREGWFGMKAVGVFAIVCLLIGIFGGLAQGTISDAEIIFSAVLIFADVLVLLTSDD